MHRRVEAPQKDVELCRQRPRAQPPSANSPTKAEQATVLCSVTRDDRVLTGER